MNIGNASKNDAFNDLVKFTLTSDTDMEDAMTSFFFKMQRLEEIFGQNIKISDLRTMFLVEPDTCPKSTQEQTQKGSSWGIFQSKLCSANFKCC